MTSLASMLVGFAVVVVGFLLARELVAWYWKINATLEVLQRMDRRLDEIAKLIRLQIDGEAPVVDQLDPHEPPSRAAG